MMVAAEIIQTASPTINFSQRKSLSRSSRDRRKPLYQAVFVSPSTRWQARAAALHCINLGKNIEHLVKDLLVAMGYKGEHGSAIVTTASRDGGIDGIINQDPLGTSTVYFQAKRYNHGNSVQRQEIEAFYGALSRIRANRGVFITTSRFSKTADETARGFSIVLIDGIMLTDLMLQYNVGVRVKNNYVLYDIDEDFFEER